MFGSVLGCRWVVSISFQGADSTAYLTPAGGRVWVQVLLVTSLGWRWAITLVTPMSINPIPVGKGNTFAVHRDPCREVTVST